MLSLWLCGKMNAGIMLPSLVIASNTIIWTRHLVFINISTSCGDRTSQPLFWSWQEFFSSKKTQSIFDWRRCLSLLKSFAAFLLSSMACNKDWAFLILYEKYWMSSCSTSLIRNSDTSMSLPIDLLDLLGSLSIMA